MECGAIVYLEPRRAAACETNAKSRLYAAIEPDPLPPYLCVPPHPLRLRVIFF
jgi:hypothetical protein